MTSEAQFAANRRNAQSSTGPRTPEGKARVRRNAVSHGLCAETTPDDGEDGEAFAKLYRSLMATYAPISIEEQTQVARIASLQWRLSRVPAVENAIHARVEAALAANDEGPPENLPAVWAAALCDPESHRAQSALQRYEGHLARQLAAAHATFQTLRKTLRASHPPLVFLSDDPEWAEVSEYAYTRDACGGEEWTPDGLMPAHGMAERRKPANDAEEHPDEAPDPAEAHPEDVTLVTRLERVTRRTTPQKLIVRRIARAIRCERVTRPIIVRQDTTVSRLERRRATRRDTRTSAIRYGSAPR